MKCSWQTIGWPPGHAPKDYGLTASHGHFEFAPTDAGHLRRRRYRLDDLPHHTDEMGRYVVHRKRCVGSPVVASAAKALHVARVPARILGVMELHLFLERGYQAFKQMGRADALSKIIEQRETDIMRRLIEGIPDPFHLHGFDKSVLR